MSSSSEDPYLYLPVIENIRGLISSKLCYTRPRDPLSRRVACAARDKRQVTGLGTLRTSCLCGSQTLARLAALCCHRPRSTTPIRPLELPERRSNDSLRRFILGGDGFSGPYVAQSAPPIFASDTVLDLFFLSLSLRPFAL